MLNSVSLSFSDIKKLMWILVFTTTILFPHYASANNTSVSAALSTTSLSLDSTAYLTITVHGARSAEIDLPEVENLVLHRRGQSSKMQVINGEISASITYTYVVQPLKEGSFTIPALTVRVKNELLATEPLSLQVIAEIPPPKNEPDSSPPKQGQELAFITLRGLDDKAYVGEILPITVKAYFRRGIRVEVQNLPAIVGDSFVLSPLSNEPRQTTEAVDGTIYSVIAWNSTLSPIKEGSHELKLHLDATLLLPQKNSRAQRKPRLFGDDFLDDEFFNGFFGGIEKKDIRIATDTHRMNIFSLPEEGKPADFSGAIGNFDIEISASPLKVEVGDPITLTMTISGKGNFDRVTTPLFSNSADWKTYTPSTRFEGSGRDYEGKKIFEQAIVARSATLEAIPAISFSYFDPQMEDYIIKTTAALPLTVQSGANSLETPGEQQPSLAQSPTTVSENLTPPPMPLHLTTGDFVTEIHPIFRQFWFIITTFITTLVLTGVISAFVIRNYRNNNEGMLKRKKLNKQLEANLLALQHSIAVKDIDGYIKSLRETIQKMLGFLWQIEASAITLHDLQKRLPSNSPLIRIFLVAEHYAYGGVEITSEEMEKYYELLKKEVKENDEVL